MSGDASRQAWLAANSLRLKLLGFLMLAVVLAALAQTAVAYRAALDEADQIFDYHMQRIADSLARGLPVAAQPSPDVPAGGDGHFDFVVQVWAADGALRFHSAPAAELPQRAVLGWSEVRAREARYRVWSVVTPAQTIQVAQDLSVRESLARGLALRTVTPVLALAPLLMFVVWGVVRRSLAPVDRVRADVASRAANDLSPLDEGDLPAEVRPLVAEINLLFARLQQAFDAQTHFVADAAHELRSPLTALKLQVQALRRAGDGPARELALARLDAGTDRAARLVEQLLALARQDAQPADADSAVDLQEMVRLAVADAAPAALRKQLDVALQPAGAATVRGQPEALRMLARNLLDNAVKYTPDGGAVQVSVQPQGGRVTLRVEDSGPGIDAALREAVLGRFHRVPGNQAPGSGLGLAIVKAVADRHGAVLTLGHSDLLGGLCVEVEFAGAPPAVSG